MRFFPERKTVGGPVANRPSATWRGYSIILLILKFVFTRHFLRSLRALSYEVPAFLAHCILDEIDEIPNLLILSQVLSDGARTPFLFGKLLSAWDPEALPKVAVRKVAPE